MFFLPYVIEISMFLKASVIIIVCECLGTVLLRSMMAFPFEKFGNVSWLLKFIQCATFYLN
jgi:hypothetical protein